VQKITENRIKVQRPTLVNMALHKKTVKEDIDVSQYSVQLYPVGRFLMSTTGELRWLLFAQICGLRQRLR